MKVSPHASAVGLCYEGRSQECNSEWSRIHSWTENLSTKLMLLLNEPIARYKNLPRFPLWRSIT